MNTSTVRKIALGLSLTATALAGAAYAQQGGKSAPGGDGVTTRAEAQAKAQERFSRMDANKDGKLDQADREARRAAMFDRIDADKNGQISRAEFDAMHHRGPRGAEGGPQADRGTDGKHGHGKHRGGWRGHRGGMMMGAMADANKDGAVSQAEFTAAAMQRFDRMDADKNGTVTREERQAARQAMREERRQRWQERAGQPAAPKTN